MALPTVLSLEDCSDFSKTVLPYLPQLYALPARFLATVRHRDESLVDLYIETNPLVSAFGISLVLSVIFLFVAEYNRNYSQVDRAWSILPTFYVAHFNLWARLAGVPSQRLDLALLWSVLWSARLTFNYARKGGYGRGHEDYRWEIVRSAVPKWAFHIFSLTFIAFFQNVLLCLIACPSYPILLSIQFEPKVSSVDLAYTATEIGLVVIEWFADQQQWDYHQAKQQYQAKAKVPNDYQYTQADLDRGFNTSGLWAYSRHPNFACEQTIWFAFYQWGCFATRSLYSWLAIGPVALIGVFQGSTWLTELITAGKYPEYKEYQRQIGTFVPTSLAYQPPLPRTPKVIRTSELAKQPKTYKTKST